MADADSDVSDDSSRSCRSVHWSFQSV